MTIPNESLKSEKNKKLQVTLLSATAIMMAVILSAVPILAFAHGGTVDSNDKELGVGQMVGMEDNEEDSADLTSPITEWVGTAAIGMTAGLVISSTAEMRRRIFTSIAVLSFAVGIIHLLLVNEHMAESYMWGIGFLVMGVSQMIYGVVMVFAKALLPIASTKRIFYAIGIAGNAVFVGIFVLARTTGVFSPDGVPVDELEANGILTIVIELLIATLLSYMTKDKKEKKQEVEDLTQSTSDDRRTKI
jgi:hypothetical protein